ncbi:hypothetical protein [Vagococcus fluvialis]|uniref:hypothetical protein n=1 Tax=Vagococcus fluvialis TaxID=2738 RepID=UPI0020334BE2|nr:hypothetical protein [Vagococcus fluvialis]MCM2139095.1 hypothetical protein [Vagococcus fluvialis]
MRKKENIDSIIVVMAILFMSFFSGNMNQFDFFKTLIHVLLIILIGLNNTWPIIANFFIFFTINFIAFSFDLGTVDWTSYLLYTILSGLLALLFCTGLYLQRQNVYRDPLRGTILKWLIKKWPDLSGITLFLLDSIVSFLLVCAIFFIIFQHFTISMLLIIAFLALYFSATNVYFYIVKPRMER